MQRLWTLMQNTANTKANILITGETGVGKSAIAKTIHKMSNRAGGPFIEVNRAVGARPKEMILDLFEE